jgi:putative endonuclease
MTYLYILESIGTGRFYIGVTDDLASRLKAHNNGYNKSTKAYRPYRLLFSMEFETKSGAMERERKLKNLKSRKKVLEWIKKVSPGSIPEN